MRVVKESELGELLRTLVVSRDTLPKPGNDNVATISKSISRDVRGRLPAYRPLSTAPVCSIPTTSAGITKLSSLLTPVWRFGARAIVVHLLVSTAGVVWITFSTPQDRLVTLLKVLLVCNWLFGGLIFFLVRSLKSVELRDNSLFISDRSSECEIPISQISHVTGPDWTTLRRTTIHLHEPCRFGKQIVFAGRLFSAGIVARNLRGLIYASEDRKRANV